MIFDEILTKINQSKKIAIFSHINPDGDAIGSSVALKLVLEKTGKMVDIFIPEPIDNNYNVLGANLHLNKKLFQNYDLAVGLDSPSSKRFSVFENVFKSVDNSINIDHHIGNSNYANLNYIDDEASSVCEIIFKIFKYWKVEISKEIATCLYAGISTDTGRFLHSNSKPETLLFASELAKLGANITDVNYFLFEKISIEEINLTKIALNKLELFENGQIAFVGLTKTDFNLTHTISQQTFRLPDLLNGIDTVKIAIVMSENKNNEFMVSIRSRDEFAQKVAIRFGGGGHPNAAGCRIFTSLNNAKNSIIRASVEVLKQ